MIKINNLRIGKFMIDGKKQWIVGKPMKVTTAPLSPRSHMKHIQKVLQERKSKRRTNVR